MTSPIRLKDISGQNQAHVISLLRKSGPLSRREISERTKLSWGGMTKIVDRLLALDLLQESTPLSNERGRPSHLLALSEDNGLLLGMDINLEGISVTVSRMDGTCLVHSRHPNETRDADALLLLICHHARKMLNRHAGRRFLAIGVAMQGVVQVQRGISCSLPQYSTWQNIPLGHILSEETGLPVYLEHDPDCVLCRCLSQGTRENALLLRIDRSAGMAAAIDGRVLRGEGILEIAHAIVVPDGLHCSCGNHGCLEAYAARCLSEGHYDPVGMAEMLLPLCTLLHNCACLFRPHRIFLTGRLMASRDRFETSLLETAAQFPALRNIPLVCFEEENHAALGAATLAFNRLLHEGRFPV